ncbi:uncharacterized protein LOC113139574 [Mastacembelus armatus]|uniref:uncharacterized protein LOC113139574 n=1 Tax=Mastacembelus armatus TaxID=205130 RepID=UPI000E45E48D|nr:uncharacterized protein LOC113139574 [Mastacembelus armatus]
MVCWILLLISLTPFTWGTFVVNVTQSSYQAEENHDITLDWTFTTTAHMSLSAVSIYCQLLTEDKVPTLFELHDGVEVPESQDKQFSGRVQFDKDVLRKGRVRLHVSRLRTEDSGLYLCSVETDGGADYNSCHLKVTAAADEPEPPRPTVGRRSASQGLTGLDIGLITVGVVGLVIVCALIWIGLSQVLSNSEYSSHVTGLVI